MRAERSDHILSRARVPEETADVAHVDLPGSGGVPAQAHLLLDFLRHNDADTIYLVGDIVDGWKLRTPVSY